MKTTPETPMQAPMQADADQVRLMNYMDALTPLVAKYHKRHSEETRYNTETGKTVEMRFRVLDALFSLGADAEWLNRVMVAHEETKQRFGLHKQAVKSRK